MLKLYDPTKLILTTLKYISPVTHYSNCKSTYIGLYDYRQRTENRMIELEQFLQSTPPTSATRYTMELNLRTEATIPELYNTHAIRDNNYQVQRVYYADCIIQSTLAHCLQNATVRKIEHALRDICIARSLYSEHNKTFTFASVSFNNISFSLVEK